jgi:hypothetical protein
MRQNFYSQFYLLNGLSKLRNLKEYSNREDIFQNITEEASSLDNEGKNQSSSADAGDEESKSLEDQSYLKTFEQKIVQQYKCDPSWPICIYDFTFRTLYPTFFCIKTATPFNFILDYQERESTDPLILKKHEEHKKEIMRIQERHKNKIIKRDEKTP